MKYSKPERLDIGRRIYEGELTRFEAAEEYGMTYLSGLLICSNSRRSIRNTR